MLQIITTSLMLLIGCDQKQIIDNDTLKFSKFPKETKLNFEKFFEFKNGRPRSIYLSDTAMILWNSPSEESSFFYRYTFPKMNLVNNYLNQGRGKGESLGPLSGGVYGNTMWIYDVTIRKVIIADLELPNKSAPIKITEYALPKYYFSTQLRDNLRLFVSGSDDSPYKIQELDLKSGKEINGFGLYNDLPDGVPLSVWKKAHESFLFLKPTGEKAVLACRLTDQLEIFDLNSKKSKVIKGPENFKAEFTAYKSSTGRDLMQRNYKTRFAFLNGFVTKKYIYLLYSGNGNNTGLPDFGNYIFQYDWDGNPVRKFSMDHYISSFTIFNNDSIIYAYDIETNYVVKAKLANEK